MLGGKFPSYCFSTYLAPGTSHPERKKALARFCEDLSSARVNCRPDFPARLLGGAEFIRWGLLIGRWLLLRSCPPELPKPEDQGCQEQRHPPIRQQQCCPFRPYISVGFEVLCICIGLYDLLRAVPPCPSRNELLPLRLRLGQKLLQIEVLRRSKRRHDKPHGKQSDRDSA